MKRLTQSPLAKWLLAALACAPLGLYLWLGTYSRLMADDYCWLALGKESGLGGMLHTHWTAWTSALSRTFFVGLLLPLDSALAPLMPAALVLLWCAALTWLLRLACGRAGLGAGKVSLALASILISATIYGMHSQQSFYWLVSSTAYTLPLVPLLFCAGIALVNARSDISRARRVMAVLALAAISFVNAGFSEMFLVFQFVVLSGLFAAAALFLASAARANMLRLLGGAWLGTLASAFVQLHAPGLAARVNSQEYLTYGTTAPIRSLPALLSRTLEATFEQLGHQDAFAGFTLAMTATLFVALCCYRPRANSDANVKPRLAGAWLWLGLLAQFILLPVLWSHISDAAQVLGRFSYAYFLVILINMAQLLVFALALLGRRRLERLIHERAAWHACIALLLLAALALFGLTQLRDIHFKAAGYLFVSAFTLLGLAWQQLRSAGQRLTWLPVYASALTLLCYASMIALSLYAQGYYVARILAPVTFLQVVSGALWGLAFGCLLRQSALSAPNHEKWLRGYKAASLIIASLIAGSIIVGQLRLLPKLSAFAGEWDARHNEIIRQRDSGQDTIVVPELSYNFAYDLVRWYIFDTAKGGRRCSAIYYEVASITRVEDEA